MPRKYLLPGLARSTGRFALDFTALNHTLGAVNEYVLAVLLDAGDILRRIDAKALHRKRDLQPRAIQAGHIHTQLQFGTIDLYYFQHPAARGLGKGKLILG